MSEQLLKERYYRNGETSWEQLSSRVVGSLYGTKGKDAYEMLVKKDFLPSTPTLVNAGGRYPMLCSCFVLPIADDIGRIADCLKETILVQKHGGGIGINFSPIRAEGSLIHGTGGKASGPVSFAGLWNETMQVVKQGGLRQGALMGILNWDHPDLALFLRAKSEEGKLTNFNLSVGVMDETPDSVLLDIAHRAWTNGEPGVVFLDNINRDSPYDISIDACNPCSEQPLPAYGACCLGSINLVNMLSMQDGHYSLDWEKLYSTATHGTRMLNRVLDATWFPVEEITAFEKKYRPIGLGVLGLADVLIRLGIPYGTEESTVFVSSLLRSIREAAEAASQDNTTLLSIAPTGSLTMIAGLNSYSIEPLFSLKGVKKISMGTVEENSFESIYALARRYEYEITNSDVLSINETGSAQRTDMPDGMKHILRTATEISPMEHLRMLEAVQGEVDSGVSKTINLPNNFSPQEIYEILLWAKSHGIKGITVYRSGSREEEVMNSCPTGNCSL